MFVNGSEINEQLYSGTSKDASYQILIHLVKRFQRRIFFLKSTNQKQVLLHFAGGFQMRRLKCEKLKDDGRQVMVKAHIAFCKVS
jgi:hypothetical protein